MEAVLPLRFGAHPAARVNSFAEEVIELLLSLPSSTVYLIVGLLCWAEAAFFLGFVTPGELAVAAGGILASRNQVELGVLVAVVVTGTMAGNATGYMIGRRWGAGILDWKPLQRALGPAIEKTRTFMDRRGEWAIVLGRLTTPTRIVVPFLAGVSRLSYRRYVLFDLPATILWASAWILLGFVLGESWDVLQDVAGTAALLILILCVAALVIRWVAARVAANQRRVQSILRFVLTVTGTQGVARHLARAFRWLGRRFDPRLAHGLNLTIGFLALVAAVGGVGLVMSQTVAVRGLALIDFPVLDWMVATRTDEAVEISRAGLRAFHWPGVLILALPLAAIVGRKEGGGAALRVGLGLVGASGGAYFLDRMVLEGVVPRAEYPSVSVAVAASLLVHITAATARRWGWGPSVATAGVAAFVVCTVALASVVAGWTAPSGIALGFALGLGWSTAVELPWSLDGPESDLPSSEGLPAPGPRETG